jgi:hypothetical protein
VSSPPFLERAGRSGDSLRRRPFRHVHRVDARPKPTNEKKTDAAEHLQVFDHVGLLVNGLPGAAGLPLI